MIRLAQVKILAACSRETSGELGPDKCAAHCDDPAEHPTAEDQKRCMNAVRHRGRIGKNSRAHDAAHHDHRGVKQPKLTSRFRYCAHSERSRGCDAADAVREATFSIPWLSGEVASRDVSTFARHDD